MKKRFASSSCSSSSSSSCIESSFSPNNDPKKALQPEGKPNKPERVRAKKVVSDVGADNSATSPKSRSSIYRGVTRHRWTRRYEAHLWDRTTWNSIQNKRGRQIYLGAYDNEEDAARTYDLAALKYWGPASILNFPLETYTQEIEDMEKLTKEEHLASLRRRSSGFSRGVSKYRGVARHHHNGRWEARIGRVCGNKYLYLGTFSTQEEAATAYDRAAIEFRGPNAVTNFDISNYVNLLNKVPPETQVRQEELQVKQEMNPEPRYKPQDEQEDANQAVQQSIPKLEPMGFMDSQAMVVMDTVKEHEHEHPWDLCLDAGFNSLPIPDIPLEESAEVFNYKGFEDDIECIFDGPLCDCEFLQDLGCKAEVDILVAPEMKAQPDASSPWSSTTTSVCSNI